MCMGSCHHKSSSHTMSIVLHSVSIRHVIAYKRHMQLRNSKTLTPKKWSQLQTTRGQGLLCGLAIRHCHCQWIMAVWDVSLHFFLVPLCWYTVSERKMLLIFCEKFIWSRQTSLSNGFSGYFRDSTIESIFLFYYSPMSMLFGNKNNKILSKTRRKISCHP